MLHEPSLNSKFIRKNNHYFNLFKKEKKQIKANIYIEESSSIINLIFYCFVFTFTFQYEYKEGHLWKKVPHLI